MEKNPIRVKRWSGTYLTTFVETWILWYFSLSSVLNIKIEFLTKLGETSQTSRIKKHRQRPIYFFKWKLKNGTLTVYEEYLSPRAGLHMLPIENKNSSFWRPISVRTPQILSMSIIMAKLQTGLTLCLSAETYAKELIAHDQISRNRS